MEVAYCLGFTLSAIEIIEYKYTNYCVWSCEQLFRDFGSSHDIVPKTWGMLLEKFKEIDELAAATCDIEEDFLSNELLHSLLILHYSSSLT